MKRPKHMKRVVDPQLSQRVIVATSEGFCEEGMIVRVPEGANCCAVQVEGGAIYNVHCNDIGEMTR